MTSLTEQQRWRSATVKPGYLVLDIHPNGHVERIDTRGQYLDAVAEGRKPVVLSQPSAESFRIAQEAR